MAVNFDHGPAALLLWDVLSQRLQDRHPDSRLESLIDKCSQVAISRGVRSPPSADVNTRDRAAWLPLPSDARVVLHKFLSLSHLDDTAVRTMTMCVLCVCGHKPHCVLSFSRLLSVAHSA